MGRYTYNSSVVSNAISELNDAINSLANVTTEIQAGINTITNANGARAIEIDYSKLLQLQTMAEDVLEEDINTIKQKVTIIEDYESAPWYKKLFSSIGMGLSKFVEGIASGIENITDGAVSIVGFVGGIFNSDFKNSVAELVAKDHVGNWFQDQYDEGFLSGVSKYSYFSENSTAANIFKGFGTAAPYIALSMTGVGSIVEVAAAGLGGIGSGTEAGINKALMNDPNLKAGDVFNKAFGQGVWQGTKNAALVYAMNSIRGAAVADDAANTMGKKAFEKAGKFADTKVGGALNSADDGLRAAGNWVADQKVVKTVTTAASKKGNQILQGIQKGKLYNSKLVQGGIKAGKGVVTAVGNTIAAHPGAAYATVGTVFALDQVDEDVINSMYREQEDAVGSVTVREYPELTETPFPTGTSTPPCTSTPPVTTTPPVSTSSPTPSPIVTTSSGGGYYPTGTSSTPAPVTPTATATGTGTVPSPTATTPQPTPTATGTQYNPTPTYTSTSYNPTPTPTQGGGGYTEEGYTGEGGTEGEFDIPETEDMSGSLEGITGGNEYTNIPTSAAPITTTTTTGAKKSIIPVIAGLGSAAVAGIGTKAFLDKKEENSSDEEEFDAEEWTEEDSLDIDYSEAMGEDGDYLDPSDEYAYQEGDEEPGSYEAVNSSELASMQ